MRKKPKAPLDEAERRHAADARFGAGTDLEKKLDAELIDRPDKPESAGRNGS